MKHFSPQQRNNSQSQATIACKRCKKKYSFQIQQLKISVSYIKIYKECLRWNLGLMITIVLSFQKCKSTINTNTVLHPYRHIYTSLWLMVIVCYQKTQEHMISQPLVRMQSSGAKVARSRSMQGRVCLSCSLSKQCAFTRILLYMFITRHKEMNSIFSMLQLGLSVSNGCMKS